MNQKHPWCWLWKPGNCVPRMPSSSKGNSYFSQEPSYNLPGLPEKFKDFADSSISHCDFFFFQVKLQVQLRFDEPLASWLKKKEDCQAGKLRCTKLSSKSSNSEDMGQPKTHWFPQWKAGAPSPWEGCFRPLWPGTSFQGHAFQFSRLLYRAQEACLMEPRFHRNRPSAVNKPQTYLWWSE